MVSRKQLIEKWENITDENGELHSLSIKNIEDSHVKSTMAQLMENQFNGDGSVISQQMIDEASQASNTLSTLGGETDGSSNSDSYKFKPIAMAIVRRSMPELFAHNVVGVQAMNSPVGLAYAIRKIYASDNDDGHEAGWDKMPEYAGYTGSTPQASAALDSYDTSATGADATSAETWTIDPSSGTWPELKTKVDKKTIEAMTRKLATSYSLESAQDIRAMLGIDLEQEMVQFLQYEIVAELDRELIARMKSAATNAANGGETLSSINVSGTSIDGRWGQEKVSQIVTAIIHQANRISTLTRQGSGNFVVVSPAIATALQSAPQGVFNKSISNVNATRAGVAEIGTLNGDSIKVYRDSYARNDYAMVGYKGATPSEAGIVYSPYIMGLERTKSEKDFSPRIGVIKRYAITDNLLGSGRYYRVLNFTNMGTIVPGA